jgi:DNA-binding NarL/FixJ family response regulator
VSEEHSIRVVVADDQDLARDGLRTILQAAPGIEVVGEAADGEQAVAVSARLQPDVLLMDIRMPIMDGLEATRRVTAAGENAPRVLVITTFDLDQHVYAALRAGSSGFVLKNIPREDLVAAVRVVANGEALITPSVTRRLIEEFARRTGPDPQQSALLDRLTARELEVLELVAKACSNAEIADRLVVAQRTVKTHVSSVLMKLNLRDRVQAVVFAYESGLVTPGERTAGRSA